MGKWVQWSSFNIGGVQCDYGGENAPIIVVGE